MAHALLGAFTYAEFFANIGVFLPIMAVSSIRHRRDPTQRLPGRWMRRFGRSSVHLTPLWRFRVEGAAPPDIASRPYVVIANHESTADPFLLSFLPWDMRWVAKEELFRMPIIGWLMRFGGDIPLKRGDRASVTAMFAEAKRTLAGGVSIMIFPEGTRSQDGELGAFKDGAFQLAIEAGVPVLPLAVAGTRECRPKGSLWFGEASAIVKVLEPISTTGLGPADIAMVRERARERIAEALPDLRARTADARATKPSASASSRVRVLGEEMRD
ncbi:MAG: 1-acyl-sn-glycerol-3-phosphate acyltransferase [Polyangiaceae bacterium]|nr:1-acyl-sn-glycerol-3-phosphate acyltransferase [Polyangiaceae bacterium]